MRQGWVPDPPLVWMQTVPPLEVNLDKEEVAWMSSQSADSFDAWLDQRHGELRATWKREQQPLGRLHKQTFAQWLDRRLEERISALRHP